MRASVLVAVLVAMSCCAQVVEKRMIGHSWDLLGVRPKDVANNLDAWERVPLDGISLAIKLKSPDGVAIGFNNVMNDPAWQREWFKEELEIIKRCSSRNLKRNFLTTFWTPHRRLKWDDESAWNNFAGSLATLAWLAKEGGAQGILIDHEDYSESRQFYMAKDEQDFAKYAALARRRGAQMMRAMATEYPSITLLSFWFLSLDSSILNDTNPLAACEAAGDLWPSFFNGMLDALPPAARLIDGNEHGYRYRAERNDFYLAAWRIHNRALALVAPENRQKYRLQVLAGFGLYLDMYTNEKDSPWYFEELDGSRLNRLRFNFAQALDAAQEYIWVYGEKMDWIKWQGAGRDNRPTWEEKLPGFTDILGRVRDQGAWAAKRVEQMRAAGTLSNCLSSGSCALPQADMADGFYADKLPTGWWQWQHETKRRGKFGTAVGKGLGDRFSLAVLDAEHGCFSSKTKVKAGELYAVEAFTQGANSSISISWQLNGKWNWSIPTVKLRFDHGEQDGWKRTFGVVEVPVGADTLALMLNVKQEVGQKTWFDNVSLLRLVP